MIKLLINGAGGRMGKKVFENIDKHCALVPACGVSLDKDFTNPNFPIYDNFNEVKEKVDVIIDFSSAVCLEPLLEFALKNSVPVVLCSTGFSKEQLDKIMEASKKIAIFRSANMSLGVNVLIQAVKLVTKKLNGFDIEIIEKHHNQKIDAPSGTALMLANACKEVLPNDNFIYGRNGVIGKRTATEIGIHAIRGGNIVGDHDVIFAGNNETVTLSHHAQDRTVFAVGAIKAAEFIYNKPAGAYDMTDMLSIND